MKVTERLPPRSKERLNPVERSFELPARRTSPHPPFRLGFAENEPMKLGIVSDIHCNACGLVQALALMGGIDELICLGDSIYEYRFSNEVGRLLRDRDAEV